MLWKNNYLLLAYPFRSFGERDSSKAGNSGGYSSQAERMMAKMGYKSGKYQNKFIENKASSELNEVTQYPI